MKLLNMLNIVSKAKLISKVVKPKSVDDADKIKRAELVKKLNKENKLLFGAVIKTKKKGKAKLTVEKVKNEIVTESEKASEFFWLIENKSKPVANKNVPTEEPKIEKNKTIPSLKKLEISNDTNTNTKHEGIPFLSKSLTEICKFPLVALQNNLIEYNEDFNERLPSVTKILNMTMSENSRKALIEWKLAKIKELGEEGFELMQKEHFRKGKEIHQAIESYLKLNTEPESHTEVYQTWQSISPVLKELNPKAELIEAFVEHPYLKYKGVVDCVSHIGTNLSVIEWKKSDKLKSNIHKTFDAPIQLAAYLGALNADPKYNYTIKTGYVAVAYTNGKPGNLYALNELDIQKYWQLWLKRLQEYWIRKRDNTFPDPI